MNERRQPIFLMAARQACLVMDREGYDRQEAILSKNAIHALGDPMIAYVVLHEFLEMSSIDQTGSEPIGTMPCWMTGVSPGEVQHEYAYPYQRAVLLLHR